MVYAADRQKYVMEVYRRIQEDTLRDIDRLYAQIQESGAESLTRTQLYNFSRWDNLLTTVRMGAQATQNAQLDAVRAAVSNGYIATFGDTMDAIRGPGRWSVVPDKLLDTYLATPWSGKDYSERIWKNTNKLASDLEGHMRDLLVRGENPAKVKAKIMKDYGVSYEVADRLIQTEVSAATGAANIAAYKESGYTHVQYILDSAPCPVCIDHAGQNGGIYPIDEAPVIPIHPRCHCRYAPVTSYTVLPEGVDLTWTPEKPLATTGESGIINAPIETPHPVDVVFGHKDLNRRQQTILELLPKYGSQAIVSKRDVSMLDLAALTANTGNEFAMFTRQGKRLIMRGDIETVPVRKADALKLFNAGYRWSGHTHVGRTAADLIASDGDKKILALFRQRRSAIYNALGKYVIFKI